LLTERIKLMIAPIKAINNSSAVTPWNKGTNLGWFLKFCSFIFYDFDKYTIIIQLYL
jgi:hypothetical protein